VSAGQRGKCPVCGHEEPAPFEIVLPTRQTTPQEELERSQKNIRRARGLDEPIALSVGDLSFVETSKRKNRVQDGIKGLENMERGLTVGDQSFASAQKDSKGLDNLYVGQGAYVASSMSESQEIQAEMMAKHRKDQEEVFRIRQIMVEQQQEKELRRHARANGLDLSSLP
jgi:hypothetical protein